MVFKYAMVCASNMNRSMEAHALVSRMGYYSRSYGTNNQVKLPGLTATTPNIYKFGETYANIAEDLRQKDEGYYTRSGLLSLVDRNAKVKARPERWQLHQTCFDVVFTFEERVFNSVCTDLNSRPSHTFTPVVVINIETQDNREEAMNGARHALTLCEMFDPTVVLLDQVEAVVGRFHQKTAKILSFSVFYY
eukprot:TRINITY_DN1307_c0_g1_i1.p1 TRINITY_DN1307_c0_g1~~TRINITY_DN1307_c0_g1_i1.p1  ORF type:complete len:192 (+),score=13.13 TRINITY_DN1307_c0_g1_i1:131-706(+)